MELAILDHTEFTKVPNLLFEYQDLDDHMSRYYLNLKKKIDVWNFCKFVCKATL